MANPKGRKKSPLSIGRAAKSVGVSPGSVRNWLKSEKELGKHTAMQGGVTFLSPQGVELLRKIKERRMANASPSLLKAWAGRKSKSAAARRKAAAAPAKSAPPTAPAKPRRGRRAAARRRSSVPAGIGTGISGDRAAKLLQTNKVRLYALLKQHGIKKSGGARSFTPDIIARLREVLQTGAAAAGKAVRAARTTPAVKAIAAHVPTGPDFGSALATLRVAVDATVRMAAEFREAMQKTLEQQMALVEKAIRPIRIRLVSED